MKDDLHDDLLEPATAKARADRLTEREADALLALSLTHFRPLPSRLRGAGTALIAHRLAFRSGSDIGISDFGIAVRRIIEARKRA